jgi:hypothetical protein
MNILMTVVLSCMLISLAVSAESATARTPVILDTDIGDDIDDTWALAMLLKSSELDLKRSLRPAATRHSDTGLLRKETRAISVTGEEYTKVIRKGGQCRSLRHGKTSTASTIGS